MNCKLLTSFVKQNIACCVLIREPTLRSLFPIQPDFCKCNTAAPHSVTYCHVFVKRST